MLKMSEKGTPQEKEGLMHDQPTPQPGVPSLLNLLIFDNLRVSIYMTVRIMVPQD